MNVEVTSRGEVSDRAKEAARTKVAALERFVEAPILGVRVVLTQEENPRIERPARAEAEVLLAGKPVRARVTAPQMEEAVDELAERLRVRMRQFVERRITHHRRPQEAEPGEWFHGARPEPGPDARPHPPGERAIIRRKSFALSPASAAEAAADMHALDHDFYLYLDAETGADAVIHHGDDGYLAVIEPPGTPATAASGPTRVPSRISEPIPLARAIAEMDALNHRFLYFLNAETGRGNVIYLRQDGHYGLIEPAPSRLETGPTHD